MKERFVAIRRDDRFSPNSVEPDLLILRSVCEILKQGGHTDHEITIVDEADFEQCPIEAEIYLSMARSVGALRVLGQLEERGSGAVNSAHAVENCSRERLDRLMRENQIAMPPEEGRYGYWLKRGDEAAQSKEDVVFCRDAAALSRAREEFRQRGVKSAVVSAHVPGDVVKFYGVGTRMFRYFYPTDDGISKFGDEQHNGKAHHYPFSERQLRLEAEKLSRLTGVLAYGGDAIIDKQGRFYIIDFNDWPSFSRCRAEAAEAIAAEAVACRKQL